MLSVIELAQLLTGALDERCNVSTRQEISLESFAHEPNKNVRNEMKPK